MPHTFDPLVIGDADPDIALGPLDEPLALGQREQLVDRGLPALGDPDAAAACGALPTRARGGTSAQPTWDEAVAAVAHYGKTHR